MGNFVFLNPMFDRAKTYSYDLSIQVSLDGFSFSVKDEEGVCLVLNHSVNYSEGKKYSFKELLFFEELFQYEYKNVSVLINARKSSLVPKELFDAGKVDVFHKLCFGECEGEAVLYDFIESVDSYMVYSFPESLILALRNKFEFIDISHVASLFIDSVVPDGEGYGEPLVYALVSGKDLHIYMPNIDYRSYYNSFVFKTDADLVYYIINIYERKSLEGSFVELRIEGELSKSANDLLSTYIKVVDFTVVEIPGVDLPADELNRFINILKLHK